MSKKNRIIVSKKKYSIVKSSKIFEGSFANIIDKNEITVIIEQDKLSEVDVIKVEKDFRLITFDMTLPFGMTGFISRVSTALADVKIPIFVISAFTTDHILIKEKYLEKAIKQLEKIGFEK